jgi:hypothetical protein
MEIFTNGNKLPWQQWSKYPCIYKAFPPMLWTKLHSRFLVNFPIKSKFPVPFLTVYGILYRERQNHMFFTFRSQSNHNFSSTRRTFILFQNFIHGCLKSVPMQCTVYCLLHSSYQYCDGRHSSKCCKSEHKVFARWCIFFLYRYIWWPCDAQF